MNADNKVVRKNNALTHAQFYRLCEFIRQSRSGVDKCNYTIPELVSFFKEKLGFDLSWRNIRSAQDACGFKLSYRIQRDRSSGRIKQNQIKPIVISLIDLYTKLGEEVPEVLNGLYRDLTDRDS